MSDPLEDGDGALYATPAYAGAFAPGCVVTVDGQDVAAGAAGPDDGLMVVDGVRFAWGRDGVLDQPTPATGRLVLFDPSRTWATREDRRGRPVTIRWEGVDNITGAPVSAVNFRGRIGSPLKVSPRTVRHPVTGARVRGSLVQVPLQSAVVDLANVFPRAGWPAESLGNRVERLLVIARQNGVLAGGATVRDYWKPPNVPPIAAADQVSLLEHFSKIYDSCGADTYTYLPETDALTYVVRRDFATAKTMGRLTRATVGPRANQGAYVLPVARPGSVPVFLDSGTLEYDPADGVTTPARITRVALSHPDEADGYKTRTIEVPVYREPWDPYGGQARLDEASLGARQAKVESLVAWNNYADTSLSDTEFLIRREGSRWLLEPLRLTARKAGGFHSVAAATLLLAGHERLDNIFAQRSWLPMLGLRPVFGVMGGTITYARQGWDVEFTPAPITTTEPQHSLTWEDLQTTDPALRLKWWDGPHPEGVDRTVTYEDLRYVGMGLDGIDPPSSSRDEQQT